MPELPEVETVLCTLKKQLKHPVIEKVWIRYDKLVDNTDVKTFEETIRGQTIRDYQRIGKYMFFILDTHCIISHMRMEGKFYIQKENEPFDEKHTHALITFTNGVQLRYHDTRKFGRMYLYEIKDDLYSYDALKHVGYDAFDERVTLDYLNHCMHKRNTAVKTLLLDQSIMAGVGNIYADEILFSSGIHPCTPGKNLDEEDIENILFHTRRILSGAIRSGGTTIRSYTSSLGVTGRFQLKLKVHSKANMPCPVCGTMIKKIKVGGRGSEFCENCQVIK